MQISEAIALIKCRCCRDAASAEMSKLVAGGAKDAKEPSDIKVSTIYDIFTSILTLFSDRVHYFRGVATGLRDTAL